MTTLTRAQPRLTSWDVAAVMVGVVVGAGIFRLPSPVAANTSSPGQMMMVWVLGGVISLIGALCYAELATTHPNHGGDYHFLHRAFGADLAYLFAWARMTVIQTGSIALQAFLIGDYLSQVASLGSRSSAVYAALVVVLVTAVNIAGLRHGKWAQHVLTTLTIVALLLVCAAGFGFFGFNGPPVASTGAEGGAPTSAIGMALVFALLAYGGWSEAAYLSAEVQDRERSIVRAMFVGIGFITALYILVNLAFLNGLGHQGMANSTAVGADLMRRASGNAGADLLSLIIAVAALSTTNATIITGARTAFAFGRDHPRLGFLGRWNSSQNTPTNALVAQAIAVLVLVVFAGATSRDGFSAMVDYTAPVFWLFLLLTGVSLFVLRRKHSDIRRPFRVPLYPLTPILFCLASAYMLYSSLAYTKMGALAGVAVLAAGVPLLLLARTPTPPEQNPEGEES